MIEKEQNKIIMDIQNDLQTGLISYDEWASREYNETKVDYYFTAINLYDAGYRKLSNTYQVIYKGVNGGYILSDEKSFEEAKELYDKCIKAGYQKVNIIQVIK